MKGDNYIIVYDWNGTLLDDVVAVHHCLCLTLSHMECAAVSLDIFREKYDLPLEKLYRNLGVPENKISEIYKVFNEYFHDNYEPLADKTMLRQGGAELLSKMYTRNIRQVVLSNHMIEPICRQMIRLKISSFFTEVLANSDRKTQFTGKPKGEKLRLYMEEHEIQPEKTIIIGDSPEETIIAKQLGLTSIAVTGGYSSERLLRTVQPDYLVHSLSDIGAIFEKLKVAA